MCGQTLSQKFKTSWKRMVFVTFWNKSAQFLSISRRIYHTSSAKLRKPCVFAIFQGLVQIEAIPYPIASIWLDCFEVETLRNIQTAKQCLVWISFVFAQNGKHWSCSTCLAMLPTAQFREGSYSFVVKHWVKSSKRIENACFFAHFGTKVHNSCQFPGEFIILYQQNSENPVFLQFSRGSFK